MSVLDRFRLDGKTLFITGGSRGLGREMALALADAGADVILVGRTADSLQQTAADIRAVGRRVDTLQADMGVPAECEATCLRALEDFGPIDILINNVGGRRQNIPTQDMPLETWQSLMDLNLTSTFVCTRSIGGAMVRRGQGGRIINIASINSFVAGRGIFGRHYETAKAAVVQFTRATAADWAPDGVTVNAICPGGFMTEANLRWSREHPEVIDAFRQQIPMGDFGPPEDLGPLAIYLASDASRYMTGAALVIDGGYTLWQDGAEPMRGARGTCMSSIHKIAAVQMHVSLGDREKNLLRMRNSLAETAGHGALLTVFPECALAGYCFDSLEEALPYAETIPGPATEQLAGACRSHDVFAVFGTLERVGERLFNVCVLLGPDGVVATYRKIHLPHLGVDHFATPGDRPFAVCDIRGLRVGMNICYDGAFPEAARVLALQGADLIVLPTNWPPGAECTAEHVVNARAMENNVYYLSANRIGTERGFRFIGHSKICDPQGADLAAAPHQEPAILYANVDPARARRKRVVRVVEKHFIDRFADRRPDMYGRIAE